MEKEIGPFEHGIHPMTYHQMARAMRVHDLYVRHRLTNAWVKVDETTLSAIQQFATGSLSSYSVAEVTFPVDVRERDLTELVRATQIREGWIYKGQKVLSVYHKMVGDDFGGVKVEHVLVSLDYPCGEMSEKLEVRTPNGGNQLYNVIRA